MLSPPFPYYSTLARSSIVKYSIFSTASVDLHERTLVRYVIMRMCAKGMNELCLSIVLTVRVISKYKRPCSSYTSMCSNAAQEKIEDCQRNKSVNEIAKMFKGDSN